MATDAACQAEELERFGQSEVARAPHCGHYVKTARQGTDPAEPSETPNTLEDRMCDSLNDEALRHNAEPAEDSPLWSCVGMVAFLVACAAVWVVTP